MILLSLVNVFGAASSSPVYVEGISVPIGDGCTMMMPMKLPVRLVPFHPVSLFEQTTNKWGAIFNHGWVQPQFEDAVYSVGKPEILEIGTADGNVLSNILKDPRNATMPIRYTCVEFNPDSKAKVDFLQRKLSKNKDNWFGWANNGDVRKFISINPEAKQNKYDFIYCGQVFHFLTPPEQISCLNALYSFLKPGGKFFLIQNSFYSFNTWIYRDTINDSELFVKSIATVYESERAKGNVWAGYNFCNELRQSSMARLLTMGVPYGMPTLHGSTTLRPLLDSVGFDVLECDDFTEIEADMAPSSSPRYATSARVGAIAQKTIEKKPDLILLAQYEAKAKDVYRDYHETEKLTKFLFQNGVGR